MRNKNFFSNVFAFAMAMIFCVGFVGCGGNDDPTPAPNPINPVNPSDPSDSKVTATITVNGASSTSLTFGGDFAEKSGIDYKQSVAISSTVQWTMSKDADWLNVSPSNGSGTLEMIIYPISENLNKTERTATITLSGSGVSATINITQTGKYDSELEASPNHIVTLAESFAFDFNFGSKVKYYYVACYSPTALERKTDEEIIQELASNSNRNTPNDDYVHSIANRNPTTQYVICSVGYDQNGKHGALTKTPVTTKSATNQAVATISEVRYDETTWVWTTTVNGFVTKYYMWFVTRQDLFGADDAAVAWFFDKEMKERPNDFAPIAQGDTWTRNRNGSDRFHAATWAVDVSGNLSGVIYNFYGAVNSSPNRVSKANNVNNSDIIKRYKIYK